MRERNRNAKHKLSRARNCSSTGQRNPAALISLVKVTGWPSGTKQ